MKKKMAKPTNDTDLFREVRAGRGKRDHQKIKPYLVLQYLLEHTDEEHTVSAADIVAYFQEYYGIDAERRSIYKDIDEINKVLYMLENECSIQEAEEVMVSSALYRGMFKFVTSSSLHQEKKDFKVAV